MLHVILCLIATSLAPADSSADFSGLIRVIVASDSRKHAANRPRRTTVTPGRNGRLDEGITSAQLS